MPDFAPNTVAELVVKLVSADHGSVEHEFTISDFPTCIGRSDAAEITIEDRWLSRQHCQINLDGDRLIVRDLDSKHGTFLNDEPVSSDELSDGDELRIGLTRFAVVIDRG